MPEPAPKLLDQVRYTLRVKHYSIRTEEAYLDWIKRYILFHHKQHPQELNSPDIEAFLTHLAVDQRVAASTQNQAYSALLFLYREVLHQELAGPINALRAKKSRRLPIVLTQTEVRQIIAALPEPYRLMAQLLYGSGLRLSECLRLRIKDIEFEQCQIIVRSGKGDKDRVTMLPTSLIVPLQRHLQQVNRLHQADLAIGYGKVYLPYALERKYPNANKDWGWQYLFPAPTLSTDPPTGQTRRHHLDESGLQKAIGQAAKQAGIHKAASPSAAPWTISSTRSGPNEL